MVSKRAQLVTHRLLSILSIDGKSSIDSVLDGVRETLGTHCGDGKLGLCLTER